MAVAAVLAAVSAAGSYQQAKQQEFMADMNAKKAEDDAKFNAEKKKKEYEKLQSQQRARFAASGVKLEGTPAEVLAQTEVDAELSAMEIIYGGKQEADAWKQKADFYGDNAGINSAQAGASTFLSSY